VTVVKEDGSTGMRRVRVGGSNRVSAENLSGLNEGERVVAGSEQEAPTSARPQRQGGRPGGGFRGGFHP
jgi:hypothetical protein